MQSQMNNGRRLSMMIKKKNIRLVLLLSIFVCVLANCSINTPQSFESSLSNSNNSSSSEKEAITSDHSSNISTNSDHFSDNEKYIVGKRVFDNDYNNCKNPEATLKIDEFPDLEFSYKQLDSCYSIESLGITFRYCYSFYIADINQDGFLDICYSYAKGSGTVNFGIAIYDIHNNTALFEKEERGTFDYLFDLDDDGCLLIEELNYNEDIPHLLNKALRFLKNPNNELLFEEFSFESKLKGFLCGAGTGNRNQYKVSILLIHVGTNDRHELSANEILAEGIVDFTYSVEKYEELSEGSPDFNLILNFKRKITTNITVSIRDMKQTIRVSVE